MKMIRLIVVWAFACTILGCRSKASTPPTKPVTLVQSAKSDAALPADGGTSKERLIRMLIDRGDVPEASGTTGEPWARMGCQCMRWT
jgi:hypothetical protein